MPELLLKNCRIFDPESLIGKDSLLIEKGRIKRLGKNIKLRGVPVYDCRGRFVVPGFIDVHLQGAGGHGMLEKTRAAFLEVSKTNCISLFLAS